MLQCDKFEVKGYIFIYIFRYFITVCIAKSTYASSHVSSHQPHLGKQVVIFSIFVIHNNNDTHVAVHICLYSIQNLTTPFLFH